MLTRVIPLLNEALGYSIFTQGETVEELKDNIKDALRCHFDEIQDIPRIVRLDKQEAIFD